MQFNMQLHTYNMYIKRDHGNELLVYRRCTFIRRFVVFIIILFKDMLLRSKEISSLPEKFQTSALHGDVRCCHGRVCLLILNFLNNAPMQVKVQKFKRKRACAPPLKIQNGENQKVRKMFF